ncbi:MAG: CocE/NonD family hydrolase C-terminal non-catalytic domain-containing protein [Candidatus Eremiobacteraeota bacterium]|nr:CocE/NonD family hydrolase C-terminal non-catalytic domain-containing protein [Candidatus Eremiobacteraeota bacterium]
MRARYRKGFDREVPLTPGAVEKYTINLHHFGHTFLKGHRLRVDVTSSASPFCNPNQNTGNPVATDTGWKKARQTVCHSSKYPSRLVLPVLER